MKTQILLVDNFLLLPDYIFKIIMELNSTVGTVTLAYKLKIFF